MIILSRCFLLNGVFLSYCALLGMQHQANSFTRLSVTSVCLWRALVTACKQSTARSHIQTSHTQSCQATAGNALPCVQDLGLLVPDICLGVGGVTVIYPGCVCL